MTTTDHITRPSDAQRPATIYDVARVAGVSHQLVSRYLKGEKGIRPANRDKVVAALRELDYRPNMTARLLATSRSHRIAVLTHEIGQVGPAQIAQGASAEARAHGYVLDIVTLDTTDRHAIDEAIGELNQQEIAGVLALASTDEVVAAFQAAEFSVPVYVGTEDDERIEAGPTERSFPGFDTIVDHLRELGHHDFFHVGGPHAWIAARNREAAYKRAVRRVGGIDHGSIAGDWSASSGYQAAGAIPPGVTAVVVANDQMAIGVVRRLIEDGRRVPDDVSVTGVDDVPEAAYITPPLTTLRVQFEEQGRASVRRLLERLHGDTEHVPAQRVELVVRQSTAPSR
ncbi:substrate-binding domain-containing protein [Curtobacterium albidum]|uniref:Substrate-binding domain-containing protein n=1 Tax=Curtobacterium citreum TaxID=2036 RepID=A0A850DUQ2_9MICO|nr:substrate-binding domain-containing protein [Curtobacterium albidum]NUU29197.1 substrate-binding domain-containing protein [Curtobacterium albidum]